MVGSVCVHGEQAVLQNDDPIGQQYHPARQQYRAEPQPATPIVTVQVVVVFWDI